MLCYVSRIEFAESVFFLVYSFSEGDKINFEKVVSPKIVSTPPPPPPPPLVLLLHIAFFSRYTVEPQWLEHQWLVYHGFLFELVFESYEILPIAPENKYLEKFS